MRFHWVTCHNGIFTVLPTVSSRDRKRRYAYQGEIMALAGDKYADGQGMYVLVKVSGNYWRLG